MVSHSLGGFAALGEGKWGQFMLSHTPNPIMLGGWRHSLFYQDRFLIPKTNPALARRCRNTTPLIVNECAKMCQVQNTYDGTAYKISLPVETSPPLLPE